MKILNIALAGLISTTCLVTATVGFGDELPTKEAFCTRMAEIAEGIMRSRQNGIPLIRAMEIAGGNETMEDWILRAYSKPSFGSDWMIQEFRNDIEVECWRVNIPYEFPPEWK